MYKRKYTDYKIIDFAKCKTCKASILDAEYPILITYYYQWANTRALYESLDGPAGWLADNQPNLEGLGDYHWTVPELTVQVYWQPRTQSRQRLSAGPDPDRKWRSRTVNNSTTISFASHSLSQFTPSGKICFGHGEPPGMAERMWSVNLDLSISGEYETLPGDCG
jgi:hypothetical protein